MKLGDIQAELLRTAGGLKVKASCTSCGWMAIGVTAPGTTNAFMTSGGQGTDIYYCELGSEKVFRGLATSYSNPKRSNDVLLDDSACNVSKGTMEFTVDNGSNENAVNEGEFALAYAYGNPSSGDLTYHGGNRGGVSGIILAAESGAGGSSDGVLPATCDSISDATSFCDREEVVGGQTLKFRNGLVDNARDFYCEGTRCSNSEQKDVTTCCSLAPPSDGPALVKLDQKMTVKHELSEDGESVTFEVTCDQCGWFAVGFTVTGTTGSFMTSRGKGTDVIFCDGSNALGLPQRTLLSSYAGITPGSPNIRLMKGPNDVCDVGRGRMKFTRLVKATDLSENSIKVGTPADGAKFALAFAYHSSSTTVSYHTGNMGHRMIALVPKRSKADSPRPTCESVRGFADDFCDAAAFGSNGLVDNSGNIMCGEYGELSCNKAVDATKCCKPAPPPKTDPGKVSATVNLGKKMSLKPLLLPDEKITLTVTCENCGWFALGVSTDGSMTSGGGGSDIAFCSGNNKKVRRMSLTSYQGITGDGDGSEIAESTCDVASGAMTFTRSLAKDADTEIPILVAEGQTTNFIYASGNKESKSPSYHATRDKLAVDVGALAKGAFVPPAAKDGEEIVLSQTFVLSGVSKDALDKEETSKSLAAVIAEAIGVESQAVTIDSIKDASNRLRMRRQLLATSGVEISYTVAVGSTAEAVGVASAMSAVAAKDAAVVEKIASGVEKAAGLTAGSVSVSSATEPKASVREVPESPAPAGENGEVALDSNLKFSANIDDSAGTISFEVTFSKQNGWFGLGASKDGSMTSGGEGSDVILCTDAGVQRFWLTDKSTPADGVEVSGATCERSNGKAVMSFTRELKAGDKQREMFADDKGTKTTLIYAYHPSETALQGNKHTKRGSKVVDLKAGAVGPDEALPVPGLVAAHGVLMLLSWGLLLPAGVTIANTQRKNPKKCMDLPFWFGMHKICQYLGWLLQIAGFAIIVAHKDGSHFESSFSVAVAHMFTGLIVVILGTLQPLNAFFRPHPAPKGEPTPMGRRVWEIFHKGAGYLATFGGMINCLLAGFVSGAYMYPQGFTVFVYVWSVLVLTVVVLYMLYSKIAGGSSGKRVEGDTFTNLNPARASALGAPSQESSRQTEAAESELVNMKDDWEEATDPGSGKTYYFNRKVSFIIGGVGFAVLLQWLSIITSLSFFFLTYIHPEHNTITSNTNIHRPTRQVGQSLRIK